MSSIQKFEDSKAWQKAEVLSLQIYKSFKKNADYGFRDQIQRASISVMNNIAEAFERYSKKEKVYFLGIAKGSAAEVRSMIHIAQQINYISTESAKSAELLTIEVGRILSGIIKSLR